MSAHISVVNYRGHLPARGTGRCNPAMGPEDKEKRSGDFFASLLGETQPLCFHFYKMGTETGPISYDS